MPASEEQKRIASLAIYEGGEENIRAFKKIIEEAMWDGDSDLLDELAHCRCCCYEHTFGNCPARLWFGCRGQGNLEEEYDGWKEHYMKFHGMTAAQFDGVDE